MMDAQVKTRGRWPSWPLPPYKYDVILADPPWKFATWDGCNAKITRHYPTQCGAWIASLPVAEIAEKDCLLWLWATQAQLHQAIDMMRAWGFEFKSAGAWAKRTRTDSSWQFGTGFLLRSSAEFFLLGTRGHPRSAAKNIRNLIVAPVREHSRKPDQQYEILESMFPKASKVELFAERGRKGWTSWGTPTGRF